jgi:D-lactate dehydrogenase
MKIVWYEVSAADQSTLASLVKDAPSLAGAEHVFTDKKLNDSTLALAEDADVISVFVNSEVRQPIIDSLPKLRFIATRSTGFDHIDVAYAKSKGIPVSSVAAYGSHTVAEFAFALILNLSRRIFAGYNHLREEESFDLSHLMGFDLAGKTIGIIGTGKIGKNTARIAKGFGMKLLGSDAFPDQAFAAEVGLAYVDLPTLLASSDIITIHAPYMKETHHLINMDNVKLIKRGALLINTARGEIVDTDALVFGLDQGIIAGAGLDVLEGERYMKDEEALIEGNVLDRERTKDNFKTILEDHMLIHNPRVIATPHMAFFTAEARMEILKISSDNIAAFAAGAPINVVK